MAAAERQSRRRRRLQGLDERMEREPGGGRRSLLERAARSWAAKHLPDLELTPAEMDRVEEFLRDEPDGSLYELRGRRRRAGSALSNADLNRSHAPTWYLPRIMTNG
jgi:hypothetical protein